MHFFWSGLFNFWLLFLKRKALYKSLCTRWPAIIFLSQTSPFLCTDLSHGRTGWLYILSYLLSIHYRRKVLPFVPESWQNLPVLCQLSTCQNVSCAYIYESALQNHPLLDFRYLILLAFCRFFSFFADLLYILDNKTDRFVQKSVDRFFMWLFNMLLFVDTKISTDSDSFGSFGKFPFFMIGRLDRAVCPIFIRI